MTIAFLLGWLRSLAVTTALAALPAQDPCVGVPGGCAPQNYLLAVIPVVGSLLVGLAGGGAVLFVIFGGVQMLLNFGDESRGTKGKTTILYAIGGFMLALASQAIVTFVHSRAILSGLAVAGTPHLDFMAAAVGAILSLMNVAFVAIIIFGAYRLVLAWGKADAMNKVWTMILWAIGGALVINASNAIVHAILRLGL